MSRDGDFVKLMRRVQRLEDASRIKVTRGLSKFTPERSGLKDGGVLIIGKALTGDFIDSADTFTCAKIFNPEYTTDQYFLDYPDIDDDDETTMYGSVISKIDDSEYVVQISGKCLFKIPSTATNIRIGDKIYPLINDDAVDITRGRVGSKRDFEGYTTAASIGRALSIRDPFVESQLVEVLVGGVSGGLQNSIGVRVRYTGSTYAGLQTIDGITVSDGNAILTSLGIYKASSDDWTPQLIFDTSNLYLIIGVAEGTLYGKTFFMRNSSGTLIGMGAYYT
jgi:hypothetical protein